MIAKRVTVQCTMEDRFAFKVQFDRQPLVYVCKYLRTVDGQRSCGEKL